MTNANRIWALFDDRIPRRIDMSHDGCGPRSTGADPANCRRCHGAGPGRHAMPPAMPKRSRMAYVWGWPMVNMLNRRAGITQAPDPACLAALCR